MGGMETESFVNLISFEPSSVSRVLCLGAHSDDIEIGALATILALAGGGLESIHWVVFSASGARAEEARNSAQRLAETCNLTIEVHHFRERYLHFDPATKEAAEELTSFAPDLVLAPWSGDAHQDHRHVSTLAAQTFRDQAIFQYEIPKYDGDLGRPNLYVPISAEVAERKLEHLEKFFPSQSSRPWFKREVFAGLMSLRGIEARSPSGFAEAFHCSKLIVGVG